MEREPTSLEHLNFEITPEQAKGKLRLMGLKDESVWKALLDSDSWGSHELKSCALIALGDEPRNLKEVYLNERKKDTP